MTNDRWNIGVGVPIENAESARIRLLKANRLVSGIKPFRKDNLVFFPITDAMDIKEVIRSPDVIVGTYQFRNRSRKIPLDDLIKTNHPNLVNNDISLKYDQIGELIVLKLDPTKTEIKLRKFIGELILSYYPTVQTVLNKIDSIEGQNRLYPIEILAGKTQTTTWHREYGLRIFCDLENAYFNPRLAEEHYRVGKSVFDGDLILDMFTGVGSFALHCAANSFCNVISVDINKHAIESLKKSISKNKLKGKINPVISDSTLFLNKKQSFNRIIINFPQNSWEYVLLASKFLKKGGIITFYQFMSKKDLPEAGIPYILERTLKGLKSYKVIYHKIGREISPSKIQLNFDIQIL